MGIEVPSVKLGKEELDKCCETMHIGNTSLKACADILGMEYGAFRKQLFKDGFRSQEAQLEVVRDSLPKIDAVRAIENKMLAAFSKLARKQAYNWHKRFGGLEYEDYLQEALMALVDAIYGYTDEAVSFITYAWWVIHNRMHRSANNSRPLSPLTNVAINLLKRFEKAKMGFNRYVTDEEVFIIMEATEEEIAIIRDASVRVYMPSEVKDSSGMGAAGAYWKDDYTADRRGIDNEKDTVPCDYEVRDALEAADLTPLERRVIDAYSLPWYGWQEEIAKDTINPATGNRYSRAAIKVILERALKKIKRVMSLA